MEQDDDLVSKKQDLKALSNLAPDSAYHAELNKEMSATGNDRGYCLLVSSLLENAIDKVLTVQISHLSSKEREAFFDSHGPAGAFSRKIALLHAFYIVGNVTRRNLDIIRDIRNAFAHGKVPLTFETPQVKALCDELRLIDPSNPTKVVASNYQGAGPRNRFHDVLATVMILLDIYVGDNPKRLADLGLKPGQPLI